VNKRRRHFNMSKTGFVSQMGNDATKTNPRDVLVDESNRQYVGEFIGRQCGPIRSIWSAGDTGSVLNCANPNGFLLGSTPGGIHTSQNNLTVNKHMDGLRAAGSEILVVPFQSVV
jgi:hypothetical protein